MKTKFEITITSTNGTDTVHNEETIVSETDFLSSQDTNNLIQKYTIFPEGRTFIETIKKFYV